MVTKPVSFDAQLRLRLSKPIHVTVRRNGHRNRQTTYEYVRNIPSAFYHLKTPHVFGRQLLGAYQTAGGIFLSEDESITVTVTKPVSSRGYVSRAANRSPCPPNDTGVVTVTSTDLYV